MVHAVASQFMPFILDALDGLGRVLHEIAGAKEGGLDVVGLQYVEYPVGAFHRHCHALLKGEVHAMFAGDIEFFCVKTQ